MKRLIFITLLSLCVSSDLCSGCYDKTENRKRTSVIVTATRKTDPIQRGDSTSQTADSKEKAQPKSAAKTVIFEYDEAGNRTVRKVKTQQETKSK